MPDSQIETFDLIEALRESCADVGGIALSRGVEFELTCQDGPLDIRGDRLFITEAIKNLIDNALKHGGENLSSVKVEMHEVDGYASITIGDDGKGLSPDQSEAAMGRFSQLDPSDESGLGLAIVASVAERHGGDLVINPAGQGASLTFRI